VKKTKAWPVLSPNTPFGRAIHSIAGSGTEQGGYLYDVSMATPETIPHAAQSAFGFFTEKSGSQSGTLEACS